LFYSFIIPCFNRPDEVQELLQSFSKINIPKGSSLEILFVDGSPTEVLKPVIKTFAPALPVHHVHRPNLAISPSRNLGAEVSKGDFLIFLDSDVLLPPDYLIQVDSFNQQTNTDCFGGPDKAHATFTNIQKAISYAMTSFFTTGGIRGGNKNLHQYNPRGFNMGVRKTVFKTVNGYSKMTCGEDIDLSIRIIKAGYSVKLNTAAYVYHKRRSTFKSFFRQVFRFGAARINIFQRHRSELKLAHLMPAGFVLFLVAVLLGSFLSQLILKTAVVLLGFYFLILFFHSSFQNKNLTVGFLSVIASVLQLTGYGLGFLSNAIEVFILGKKDGMELGASK
jgi:cellulose synthase/poly-beta-1,6-N-acetylglucosamine synthase-like glycosyltransferase